MNSHRSQAHRYHPYCPTHQAIATMSRATSTLPQVHPTHQRITIIPTEIPSLPIAPQLPQLPRHDLRFPQSQPMKGVPSVPHNCPHLCHQSATAQNVPTSHHHRLIAKYHAPPPIVPTSALRRAALHCLTPPKTDSNPHHQQSPTPESLVASDSKKVSPIQDKSDQKDIPKPL